MDHVMSNFGNINYKTELEMKVSLLEKENFELRVHLIDKLLIITQLKTDSKSNPYPTNVSTTTNTVSTPAQTNDNINSNTAIMIIITKTITTTSTTITAKARAITTATTKMKRTIIALMKRQFTTKSYKLNCKKFERIYIQFFLNVS